MTIPQLTVPDDFGPMLPGQLAEAGNTRTETRVSATLEANFGFVAFAHDTDPEVWEENDDTGNLNPIGIIQYSHSQPTTPSPTNDVLAKQTINVLKSGVIWVTTVGAVTNLNDDVVSYVATTGAITVGGTALVGAKFKTLAGAGEVVKVELNLP